VDLRRIYDPAAANAAPDPALVRRLQTLAYWLDDRFRIPGTRRRVGMDGVIGLLPGIGDLAAGALAAYIIIEAWRLGVPRPQLAQMALNVGIDTVVGSIPVVGNLFDFAWKANRRNVAILLRHLEARAGATFEPAAETVGRRRQRSGA
jgi:hypothetical protein